MWVAGEGGSSNCRGREGAGGVASGSDRSGPEGSVLRRDSISFFVCDFVLLVLEWVML